MKKFDWIPIISLFIAIYLWYHVNIVLNPYTISEKTLVLNRINNEKELNVNIAEKRVKITLDGRRKNILRALYRKKIKVYIDLKGLREGTHTVPVKVDLPEEVLVIKKDPSEIKVKITEWGCKKFPVEYKIIGKPAEGFTNLEPILYNKIINVYGAKSVIQNITKAFIKVDVTGLLRTINEKSFNIELHDKNSKLISKNQIIGDFLLKPDVIKVKIPIVEAKVTKEVEIIAKFKNKLKEPARLVKFEIIPKKIFIEGSRGLLKNVQKVYTEDIDLENIKKTVKFSTKLLKPLPNLNFVGKKDKNITVELFIKNFKKE